MRPRQLVEAWVDAFNRGASDELAALYHDDAVNHQVNQDPVVGRDDIRAMFAPDFSAHELVCTPRTSSRTENGAFLNGGTPRVCADAASFTSSMAESYASAAIGTD